MFEDRLKSKSFIFQTSYLLAFLLIFFLVSSCANDPRKVDAKLKATPPAVKTTTFTKALRDLGLMTEIYDTAILKILSKPISDLTGTSGSTGGEIPRDITEMIKSSLNSIGGNVLYIPYDPNFMANQINTEYSRFEKKIIPEVVLSGGITEFDRGLSTKGENTDIDGSASIPGSPTSILSSGDLSLRGGIGNKQGLARITLDFNLLNFETMVGIQRNNTVTTMEVHKAVAGKELGIGLFGINFGLKGTSKKVQGRHAAIRLLVEMSMIQIIGKYFILPYWRLLGDDAKPGIVVVDGIENYYFSLNESEVILKIQEWLFLYGYDVTLNGTLDPATISALKEVDSSFGVSNTKVNVELFKKIYFSIPINKESLGRRMILTKINQNNLEEAPKSVVTEVAKEETPEILDSEGVQSNPAPVQSHNAQASNPPEKEKQPNSQKKSVPGIGRILSDEEF